MSSASVCGGHWTRSQRGYTRSQTGRRYGSRVYWRCWRCTWLWPINCDV